MCTLTYLPNESGYTFTHNRDERQDRPSSRNFRVKEIAGQKVYYPEDLEANGSWIAYSDRNRAICLLNGGSKLYERNPPYRHSRGLVVLDNYRYATIPDFYKDYNFDDLEPFTLVIRDQNSLWKLTHNEHETLLDELNPQERNIWSSTTLYTQEVQNKRRRWFENWLEKDPSLEPVDIRTFHTSAGDGDSENDLIMSRWGILKTLSITQIAVRSGNAYLHYEDFIQDSVDEVEIHLMS